MSRAVLFDLFNTLVPGTVGPPAPIGPALGVDAVAFDRAFAACWRRRFMGELGDLASTLRSVAHDAGGDPTDAQVASATSLRLARPGSCWMRCPRRRSPRWGRCGLSAG